MLKRIKYSIIIPSYNQDRFIEQTFKNILELKERAKEIDIDIEVLLFDNESNEATQKIIQTYKGLFDYIEIKKDKGQYDAINKGIARVTGHYWTWLNTDDLIEADGFLKLAELLKRTAFDYTYGSIIVIDEEGKPLHNVHSTVLNINNLVNNNPGIYQPGSFFSKEFSNKIGLLAAYECCFDYEYILRSLKEKVCMHRCSFPVAKFRLHKSSKTKSRTIKFVKEQLAISKLYGRKPLSRLAFIAFLRQIKHRLNRTS